MTRVQHADTQAFEAIYDRYRMPLLRHATRITGSQRVAEEATQDAFLSLWRSAAAYDTDRGSLRSWLFTMVRNRCIDCLRREARHLSNIQIEEAPSESLKAPECTEDLVASREDAHRARQLMLTLPAEQQRVIELTYFKGLTHTEVAAKVGIPLGTVKGRQRLALKKMHHAVVAASS